MFFDKRASYSDPSFESNGSSELLLQACFCKCYAAGQHSAGKDTQIGAARCSKSVRKNY